jgi:hypothetical protein
MKQACTSARDDARNALREEEERYKNNTNKKAKEREQHTCNSQDKDT